MRIFSKGRLTRAVAHLLTLAFLWSVALTSVVAVPAAAQIPTRTAATQSVAVVPFDNLSGFRPETLGEEASAAVAVELRDRLLLDILPKADVTLQMRDLDMTAPLSDVELVRLAAELEVALVIAGQVRAVRISRSPQGPYAEVVLAVRLFDRVARADVNGALVSAEGPASPDASEEVLVRKVLEQAAFQAVEEMRSRPTITGMVMWSKGDAVFLNVGTRGGLRPGMKLVAIRSGERIGVVKVTEADAVGSYADVIQGASLRTGDHLRAIYELPREVGVRPAKAVARTAKRFEKVLLFAGILFGLGAHASRARLLEEGGIAAPSFRTSNLANGPEMGASGWVSSIISMFGEVTPTAATLTTWESYSGTQKRRIVAYEIRRDGQLVDVLWVETFGDNVYIDGIVWPAFRTAEFDLDGETGDLTEVVYDIELYEPTFDDETGLWEPESWTDFVDGISDDIGIEAGLDTMFYGWLTGGPDWGGPFAGGSYVYRVRPLIMVQARVGAGQYLWTFSLETELSSDRNFVVGVGPTTTSPWYWVLEGITGGVYEVWDAFANPVVGANTATFFFYSPVGADEVIIQVARDPNITFDVDEGVYTQTIPTSYLFGWTVDVNLAEVPGTGGLFWWRIGARNRRSAVAPRPWPLWRENDHGYVWSNQLSFSLASASRAALLHEQRNALTRSSVRGARALPPRAAGDRVMRAQ